MGERMRQHIRSNVVGYIALFCFAMGGTAWATHPGGANTINSADIIDGEVKTPDIANAAVGTNKLPQGAVTTGKVKDEDLTGGDVADGTLSGADVADNSLDGADVQPLGAHDISDSAFDSDDIRDVVPFDRKLFGIPTNAIETSEIENNQVTSADIADGTVAGSDLATSAKPIAYAHEDEFTGGIGNFHPGSTEGKLTLPPGTYVLSAKIVVGQFDSFEDLFAVCGLDVAGTRRDESEVRTEASFNDATLPLQSVDALPSGGAVKVICWDNGLGDVFGSNLKITAIQIGSIG
jgi:hypothetical protein